MFTEIDLKCNNEKEEEEEEEEEEINHEKKISINDYYDNEDIEKQVNIIKNKQKTFKTLWLLYYILDKFFLVINFSTILISIFIAESNLPLTLSIYTLSFSMIFDSKRYIPILEKLIILYSDEIIPEINKFVRKYCKIKINNNNNNDNDNNNNDDDISDVIYNLHQIEKDYLNKYLGCYFFVPKRLRSIDGKKIISVIFIYIVSFIALAVICYFKSIGKLFG